VEGYDHHVQESTVQQHDPGGMEKRNAPSTTPGIGVRRKTKVKTCRRSAGAVSVIVSGGRPETVRVAGSRIQKATIMAERSAVIPVYQ